MTEATNTIALQSILLPEDERLEAWPHLFYRTEPSRERPGDRVVPERFRWALEYKDGELRHVDDPREGSLSYDVDERVKHDRAKSELLIGAGATADFSCYFNMLSANKIRRTTYAESFSLLLRFKGTARLRVMGYTMDDFSSIDACNRYKSERYQLSEDSEVRTATIMEKELASDGEGLTIELGRPEATLLGFSLTACDGDVLFLGGEWLCQVAPGHVRPIELGIASTTFKKEEFIARNIDKVKGMLAEDPELAEHFTMFVVDNGQTLRASDFEDEHVKVFPNENVGGSGGFARGMIEALRCPNKRFTHLIIMDDDVLVLTESIKRTYRLLSILRPEYHDHYIAGAMLRLDVMDAQHEDIGYVHCTGPCISKKEPHRVATILECASNEVEWADFGHEYAAWWYCCIPMRFISETSLPVPLFIRGDDIEFSMRAGSKILSFNGICVWHLGFEAKFNANMEYYQVLRNSLIIRAFHEDCYDIAFINWCEALINRFMNSFIYQYVDLVCDAIEDFLDGPSIIEVPQGLAIIQEKAKLNEELFPIAEVIKEDVDLHLRAPDDTIPNWFRTLRRKTVTFSLNGQKHFQSWVGDETGYIPYDWEYLYDQLAYKKRLVAIDPEHGLARLRERDEEAFARTEQRRQEVFARYEAEHEQAEAAWREAYARFTTLEFWKQYLGIS